LILVALLDMIFAASDWNQKSPTVKPMQKASIARQHRSQAAAAQRFNPVAHTAVLVMQAH
jgi:hypothetical protein